MAMTAETAIRLKNAGYPQPEYMLWRWWYLNGTVLGFAIRDEGYSIRFLSEIPDDKSADVWVLFKDSNFEYAPPVEELLQHPFSRNSEIGYVYADSWQARTTDPEDGYEKYFYGPDIYDLLGTLLAEHLEKQNNEGQ